MQHITTCTIVLLRTYFSCDICIIASALFNDITFCDLIYAFDSFCSHQLGNLHTAVSTEVGNEAGAGWRQAESTSNHLHAVPAYHFTQERVEIALYTGDTHLLDK